MYNTFLIITIAIAIISVLLALIALKKQSTFKELKKVKKDLAKRKIIYHKDSSA